MNAVEIEEAIAHLAEQSFDAEAFPFAFLEAFGNKKTTIKRLKTGSSNASDIDGGVLQRSNIHIAVCGEGDVTNTLGQLKASPTTSKAKARFVLATDGVTLEAEDLTSGEPPIVCHYSDFPNHFGFFLPLAGITTVKQIRNNPIDIQATGRLNRLYVQLLKDNEEWASEARRHDMNHFMARLIFCFFAEDTDIFNSDNRFTATIEQMSDSRSDNTEYVLGELFRAMDIHPDDRATANLRNWADDFPYVNGGLFTGNKEIPRFSRIARSYLLHAGRLNWKEINPDIFGSMIQAVANDDERGELGMHYTSVPNILKVLNPLFLDDLREQLEQAGENPRKLLNLRKRIANIRVFDPACGSGNFLVIAYIQMREIEAEILRRRGEANQKSWIRLENFYGIELKDFAVEVARLSLLIAEFQCDVRLIGQKEAKALVLPLKKTGQIHQGNALRMDWLEVCPPTKLVEQVREDLFDDVPEKSDIEFDGQDAETYICGNPPYKESQTQNTEQKTDLDLLFKGHVRSAKQLDYVSGWFFKAAQYGKATNCVSAFVSTNSICQGRIVSILWPLIFQTGCEIVFAHTSFKWANLAAHNAGVTVVIVGVGSSTKSQRCLYSENEDGETNVQNVGAINPYLTPGIKTIVEKRTKPLGSLSTMDFGNMPVDGGALLLSRSTLEGMSITQEQKERFIKNVFGSSEFIRGTKRFCLWITEHELDDAQSIDSICKRIYQVKSFRLQSKDSGTRALSSYPYRFREQKYGSVHTIIVPSVSSENRSYLPVGLLDNKSVVTNLAFALYDAPLWNMALIASRIHLVWIATVCGKMKTDFRYSNTLGWNTFPVPPLTEKNRADLTRCAEEILLAREAHFPATIADLYAPDKMPDNLRRAHERNDEVLERIYIGRRFKNDTERLEKLFDLYTKMTTGAAKSGAKVTRGKRA
ncbi:MAG: N-6 DNA methylase [Gammaproteobacteria bacterium]|nr:N-6 DNA methylase [Gammaproteobacteria bacterium]MCF6258914.1 N-6 DNA methylase [Gammaproteobacteria bacterium]